MKEEKKTDAKTLRVLLIGDIMGKPGRKAVTALLPNLRKKLNVDFVIANAENLAHGKGVNEKTFSEIRESGVDFCTSGNHIFSKAEGVAILEREDGQLIRPANYPAGTPGKGEKLIPLGKIKLLVVNLLGRIYMNEHVDCPFRALDEILERHQDIKGVAAIVDFHANATSEKNSFGIYADGRVAAVVGTHTHIPTADVRILPKGTAYTTDIGMVGIRDSSIGIDAQGPIQAFLTQRPAKFELPDNGLVVFNAVLLELDAKTGAARAMTRIQKEIEV